MLLLTKEEQSLLITLLTNAKAEVDASADPDSVIQPDNPNALMDHYDMATRILKKLEDHDNRLEHVKVMLRTILSGNAHLDSPLAKDLLAGFDRT